MFIPRGSLAVGKRGLQGIWLNHFFLKNELKNDVGGGSSIKALKEGVGHIG